MIRPTIEKGGIVTEFGSVAVGWLSAVITVKNASLVQSVMFYINLGLMLCAVVELTVLFVLYRKTSCASVVGLSAIMIFIFGMVLFFVQLLLFVYNNGYAMYAISLCMCVMYASFLVSGVYSVMLSRNSHKTLCIFAGVLDIIPPVGVALTVVQSFKIKRDTPMQEFVYNGYAYTYAALGEFCAVNKAAFTDMAGGEDLDSLGKKDSKRKLKELKHNIKTASGQYAYAAAVAAYTPQNTKTVVKYMKKAAAGGHAAALFNMGYYYELGAYVAKDLKKAKELYTRAAAAGDADAPLRLAILEIKAHNPDKGFSMFRSLAEEKKDHCAKYNMAVCYELGLGVEPDIHKALDIYCECDKKGEDGGRAADVAKVARRRIFAIAATDINSSHNGDFFRKVSDRPYTGVFRIMMDGLIEIKKRHAADAADKFLLAVKRGGEWEGLARCLVGTLYIDCGKEHKDRINGAEFIQSAIGKLPAAMDMYSVIPAALLKEVNSRGAADKKVTAVNPQQDMKKEQKAAPAQEQKTDQKPADKAASGEQKGAGKDAKKDAAAQQKPKNDKQQTAKPEEPPEKPRRKVNSRVKMHTIELEEMEHVPPAPAPTSAKNTKNNKSNTKKK